jgi:hypothetical protein
VLGVGVLVLVRAHGPAEWWPVAWPGVLTGVGTLALAGVTFSVLLADNAAQVKRDAQDKRRDEQERRAQAARVQVTEPKIDTWVSEAGVIFDVKQPPPWQLTYIATIQNRSDDAIGDVWSIGMVDPRRALRTRVEPAGVPQGRITAGDFRAVRFDVRLTRDTQARRRLPHIRSVGRVPRRGRSPMGRRSRPSTDRDYDG